jgi:hypothetical protein
LPFRSFKTASLCALVLLVFFVISGYVFSDDYFFKSIIRHNRITTPEEAFTYVENNTRPAPRGMKVPTFVMPRTMLTKQTPLKCDQSAIVLATIVHALGQETRLVDLLGDDGISHHTILEVNQNGSWKTYDTLQNLQGVTYYQSAKSSPRADSYTRIVQPAYRPYPRFYNWVTQNNFYLKHLALTLRGRSG